MKISRRTAMQAAAVAISSMAIPCWASKKKPTVLKFVSSDYNSEDNSSRWTLEQVESITTESLNYGICQGAKCDFPYAMFVVDLPHKELVYHYDCSLDDNFNDLRIFIATGNSPQEICDHLNFQCPSEPTKKDQLGEEEYQFWKSQGVFEPLPFKFVVEGNNVVAEYI